MHNLWPANSNRMRLGKKRRLFQDGSARKENPHPHTSAHTSHMHGTPACVCAFLAHTLSARALALPLSKPEKRKRNLSKLLPYVTRATCVHTYHYRPRGLAPIFTFSKKDGKPFYRPRIQRRNSPNIIMSAGWMSENPGKMETGTHGAKRIKSIRSRTHAHPKSSDVVSESGELHV